MSQSEHQESNAPSENGATKVLDALLEHETRGNSGAAARRHVRKRWTVELQVRIEETVDLGMINREIRVTTQDLSRGGYSFLCRQYLHVGSQVQAWVMSLPNSPVLMGTVVNCSYDGNGYHRVGVKLLLAKTKPPR